MPSIELMRRDIMGRAIFNGCLLWALASFSVNACATPRTVFYRKPYEVVRTQLMKSGYKVVSFAHRGNPCPDDQPFCNRYPEVISCSGTGRSICEFAFFRSRDKKYFVVTTFGEELPRVESIAPASRGTRKGWDPEVR